jgi:hypothetical protein
MDRVTCLLIDWNMPSLDMPLFQTDWAQKISGHSIHPFSGRFDAFQKKYSPKNGYQTMKNGINTIRYS